MKKIAVVKNSLFMEMFTPRLYSKGSSSAEVLSDICSIHEFSSASTFIDETGALEGRSEKGFFMVIADTYGSDDGLIECLRTAGVKNIILFTEDISEEEQKENFRRNLLNDESSMAYGNDGTPQKDDDDAGGDDICVYKISRYIPADRILSRIVLVAASESESSDEAIKDVLERRLNLTVLIPDDNGRSAVSEVFRLSGKEYGDDPERKNLVIGFGPMTDLRFFISEMSIGESEEGRRKKVKSFKKTDIPSFSEDVFSDIIYFVKKRKKAALYKIRESVFQQNGSDVLCGGRNYCEFDELTREDTEYFLSLLLSDYGRIYVIIQRMNEASRKFIILSKKIILCGFDGYAGLKRSEKLIEILSDETAEDGQKGGIREKTVMAE